jgi:N-acetylneuraminic acid mutarotase
VSVVNGVLYALGGSNGNALNTVEAYDPATNTWTTKAPMSTPRWEFASGVISGKIYALGGITVNMKFKSVEAYDPATNTWTPKAPMPDFRWELAAGVAGRTLYAVDGCCAGNSYAKTLWAFNP